MTETKATYSVGRDTPALIVGTDPDEWDSAQDHVIVLPAELRAHFQVEDDGKLLVNGEPDAETFIDLWNHLHRVHRCVQLAMGNALVYAQEHYGDEFVDILMDHSELSYWTYRQRMSVARNVPPENQDPTVSWSKLRAIAPAPPPVQRKLLDEVHAGTLTNSQEVVERRKEIMRTPDVEYPARTPVVCPICGDVTGWDADQMDHAKIECGHCHAHVRELVDRANIIVNAVIEFLETGDRAALDALVDKYHI